MTVLEEHIKLVPKCVNVTRQDCVTKWVVTATGEKVINKIYKLYLNLIKQNIKGVGW